MLWSHTHSTLPRHSMGTARRLYPAPPGCGPQAGLPQLCPTDAHDSGPVWPSVDRWNFFERWSIFCQIDKICKSSLLLVVISQFRS